MVWKNHFYHSRWPCLNVTIFITHVRNDNYANVFHLKFIVGMAGISFS